MGGFDTNGLSDTEMLLNPESFQAVGKVEGWSNEYEKCVGGINCTRGIHEPHNPCVFEQVEAEYRTRMHLFVDALCDGKDLEEALNEATV